jgi:hypothetical protein
MRSCTPATSELGLVVRIVHSVPSIPRASAPCRTRLIHLPQDSVIVTCSCCWAAYRYSPAEIFKGLPGPSSNCYDRGKPAKQEQRPNAVLLIAASLIAAVRLNRVEIKPSPVVFSKIADSIRLAEMIQARLRG